MNSYLCSPPFKTTAPGTEDAAVADLVDRVADERAPVEGRVDAAERLRDLLEDSAKVREQ